MVDEMLTQLKRESTRIEHCGEATGRESLTFNKDVPLSKTNKLLFEEAFQQSSISFAIFIWLCFANADNVVCVLPNDLCRLTANSLLN